MTAAKLWKSVESKIAAGNFPPVFITRAGTLALDGQGAEVPARIAAMFPEEVRRAAAEKAAAVRAAKDAEDAASELRRQELIAAQEARIAPLKGENGWLLLAGENTAVVATGTYDQCVTSLPMVCRQRRDSFAGRGCWVLLAPNGEEYMRGTFGRDSYV